MSRFTTAQLADRLFGSFGAIYQQWQLQPPKDSHLWELAKGKSALQILEQDMINIGHYFSAADSIGTQGSLTKKERKGLRRIYRQQLVKRSALLKIVAAWLITVPVSALLAAMLFFMIRGMMLP